MNERQSDFEWLRDFARHGDQAAFASLVKRHLDLVYATACRKVQDHAAAEEIAQNVFGVLVRKAWTFASDDSLPAWLYKTTLLESRQWLRGEMRRRRREQTAAELGSTMNNPDEQPALRALLPMLDEALLSLREKDRAALLLRFYEKQSLRDVGASLGVSEDTAQKRVATALEKLSGFFKRRGFRTATTAAAAAALEHTAVSAPATLASSVALASAQMAPPALLGLTAIAARIASLSKMQVAAACLVIAAAPAAWEWQQSQRAREETLRLQSQLTKAQADLSSTLSEIDRWNASANQLAAAQRVQPLPGETGAAEALAAWKKQLRERLMAGDYHWLDNSPFVRIPKSVLPKLRLGQTVSPPGVLTQSARELLGLTPDEREQTETALQNHVAKMSDLMNSAIYETNQAPSISVSPSAAASKIWVVPPLGDSAQASVDGLKSALANILDPERWQLANAELQGSGFGSTGAILGLNGPNQEQRAAAWIQSANGQMITWFLFSTDNSSSSYGGQPLASFAAGGDSQTADEHSASYWWMNNYPAPLVSRMTGWLQQQAEAAGKAGK